MAAAAAPDAPDAPPVLPPVKHVLSRELQLYFERVAAVLRSAEPSAVAAADGGGGRGGSGSEVAAAEAAAQVQRAVLASLASDPGESLGAQENKNKVTTEIWAMQDGAVKRWSAHAAHAQGLRGYLPCLGPPASGCLKTCPGRCGSDAAGPTVDVVTSNSRLMTSAWYVCVARAPSM